MSYDLSAQIKASIKLVIWDLDETFWNGTLSEGGIEAVQAHVDMVRTLVDRGIMCSVCSKNDFDAARAELQKLDIWDMFVFPQIQWAPKGQAIAAMIAQMGLRDENVLFLDDNHLNLEEAQFFNPGLMVVDASKADLLALLVLPELKGKDDRDHSRLEQYRVMQDKMALQAETGLSNIEFLRQSGIRVKIITDIENHMDRVLEILNRTNQLNFTKIRANTPEERDQLEKLLAVSGMHAGLIHVRDRYGDYGVVGFFCVRTKFSGTTVHHFAFSCRTLNMGVEQWVWEYLNKPEIKVVNPVANPVQTFDRVEWITEVTSFDDDVNALDQKRLCLVGGCDLLQVSFYCGTNRDEFVNMQDENEMLVRFDDVGFFLTPRDITLKHNKELKSFVGYTYEDMLALDKSLAAADVILLSMYFSVPSDNLFTYGGKEFGGEYYATIPPRRLKKLMKDPDQALRFAKAMFHRRLPLTDRLELTRRSLEHAAALRNPETPLFVLGAATLYGAQAERTIAIRNPYNAMCREFCAAHPNAFFIDVDELLDAVEFSDSDHYTRTGYFKIAEFVNQKSDENRGRAIPTPQIAAKSAPRTAPRTAPNTPVKTAAAPVPKVDVKAAGPAAAKVAERTAEKPKPAFDRPAIVPARSERGEGPETKVAPVASGAGREPQNGPDRTSNAERRAMTERTTEKESGKSPERSVKKPAVTDGGLSKLERYMAFLLQEWARMAETPLRSADLPPHSKSEVLPQTIRIVGKAPGLRLEFGVWRGNSIKACAKAFPDQHWYGFDSFEGFPDDGRKDWQKPFKVIELPDTPKNVTLVKGYFSDTLDPFLAETPGEVAFVNVDCDIYSSTVDIFAALHKHDRLKPGQVIYFDELINYADYMWNESLALFEMLEETGLGVEWLMHDHRLRQPEQSIQYFFDGDHPVWMEDLRGGYWVQAACRLTDTPIDLGPVNDRAYREKLKWMVEGFTLQEAARQKALDARNERLVEMEKQREARYVERKRLEKERQAQNRIVRDAARRQADSGAEIDE